MELILLLNSWRTELLKSSFLKNIAILMGGTGLAESMGILFSPLLSRLYTPEEFGLFGTIMSFSSIFITVSCLRYESAIVIEKNDTNAQKLQDLSVFIILSITTILISIFLIVPSTYFWLDEKTSSSVYFLFSFPIIIGVGLFTLLFYRLNREEEYKTLAKAQFLKKGSLLSIQAVLGFIGFTSGGLIIGSMLAPTIAIVYIFYTGRNKIKLPRSLSFPMDVAYRYRDFPFFSAPQSLLNSIMAQLPVIVLAAYYPITVVGSFYFAWKIVQMPGSFMGQSIRTVFLKEAVKRKDNLLSLYRLLLKTTLALTLIITIPILMLVLAGPTIFSFIFGAEWAEAGKIASWLMIWFGTNFIQSPCRTLFLVFEKQKLMLGVDLAVSIARSIVLLFAAIYLSAISLIALFSIISSIFFIGTIVGWHIYLKRVLSLKTNYFGN